jgi:nitroreductase
MVCHLFLPTGKNMNETLKVIHNRKSVRHFTDQAVSKEQSELLLRAGMAAPTAVNGSPGPFMWLPQRETLDALGEQLPYAKMLLQAQAAIIVCGDMEKAGNLKDDRLLGAGLFSCYPKHFTGRRKSGFGCCMDGSLSLTTTEQKW